MFQTIMKFS